MANETTVALLYAETCKLAYTETRLSINQRAPFDVSDEQALSEQATQVADCAKDLRAKSPLTLVDSQVNDALAQVRQAQTLFDYINNTNGAPPEKQVFFEAVASAVLRVNSL